MPHGAEAWQPQVWVVSHHRRAGRHESESAGAAGELLRQVISSEVRVHPRCTAQRRERADRAPSPKAPANPSRVRTQIRADMRERRRTSTSRSAAGDKGRKCHVFETSHTPRNAIDPGDWHGESQSRMSHGRSGGDASLLETNNRHAGPDRTEPRGQDDARSGRLVQGL